MIFADETEADLSPNPAPMHRLILTLMKIVIASLIAGTILSHFGITSEKLMSEVGLTPERIAEMGRQAWDWALPNVMLGAIFILPIWFVIFLFTPAGPGRE
jgi:hypothetical protein